jgi:hypothetical protein
MTAAFAPGDLVQARGREWVSLPSSVAGPTMPASAHGK